MKLKQLLWIPQDQTKYPRRRSRYFPDCEMWNTSMLHIISQQTVLPPRTAPTGVDDVTLVNWWKFIDLPDYWRRYSCLLLTSSTSVNNLTVYFVLRILTTTYRSRRYCSIIICTIIPRKVKQLPLHFLVWLLFFHCRKIITVNNKL